MKSGVKVSLGEVADLQVGFPFKSKDYSKSPDAIKLVRGDNVVQGNFRWESVKKIELHDVLPEVMQKYSLALHDVTLAMDRPWISAGLKYSSVFEDDLPCLLVQRVCRLRAKDSLDQRFLKYVIGSAEFTAHIRNVETGTAVPHISQSSIAEFSFSLPGIEDQKAIAHILGTLDDKIELNHKMNHTLEEIAKAIFKSWFVDFDPVRDKAEGRPTGLPPEISDLFPDELVDSEIGEIPKGWESTTLSEVTSVIGRGVTPKYSDEGIAILNQKCIRNWSINSNLARSTSSEKKYKEEKYLQEYDCVINSTGVGTLGRVAICDSRHLGMLCDSHVSIVRGITPEMSLFTSMRLALMEPEIENLGHGSTGQTELSRIAIGETGITLPCSELLNKTISLISPFIERRRLLDLENETLADLRGALLPKLISGELRIPDAKRFLEEAGI